MKSLIDGFVHCLLIGTLGLAPWRLCRRGLIVNYQFAKNKITCLQVTISYTHFCNLIYCLIQSKNFLINFNNYFYLKIRYFLKVVDFINLAEIRKSLKFNRTVPTEKRPKRWTLPPTELALPADKFLKTTPPKPMKQSYRTVSRDSHDTEMKLKPFPAFREHKTLSRTKPNTLGTSAPCEQASRPGGGQILTSHSPPKPWKVTLAQRNEQFHAQFIAAGTLHSVHRSGSHQLQVKARAHLQSYTQQKSFLVVS